MKPLDDDGLKAMRALQEIGQGVLVYTDKNHRICQVLLAPASARTIYGVLPRACVDVTEELAGGR